MDHGDLISNFSTTPNQLSERGNAPLVSLLRLFPRAIRMDVSILVGLPERPKGLREKTRVLFGCHDAVVFRVGFPITCGTTMLLGQRDGSGEVPVTVVASVPDEKGVAVAVRFRNGRPAWLPRS